MAKTQKYYILKASSELHWIDLTQCERHLVVRISIVPKDSWAVSEITKNVSEIIQSSNVRNKSFDDSSECPVPVSNWRQVRKVSSEDWTQLKWLSVGLKIYPGPIFILILKRLRQTQRQRQKQFHLKIGVTARLKIYPGPILFGTFSALLLEICHEVDICEYQDLHSLQP